MDKRSRKYCNLSLRPGRGDLVEISGKMLILLLVTFVCPASSELEYFPGLRRPPPISDWSQSQESDFLTRLFEKNARERLQQQLSQHYYQNYHHQFPKGTFYGGGGGGAASGTSNNNNFRRQDEDLMMGPSFTYKFPEKLDNEQQESVTKNDENSEIPFAVNPSDPRYYAPINSDDSLLPDKDIDDSGDNEKHTSKIGIQNVPNGIFMNNYNHNDDQEVPYFKPKPPMNIIHKLPSSTTANDLNSLMEKLQREENARQYYLNAAAGLSRGGLTDNNRAAGDVMKKHMELDGAMGMYIVALIAGVSAAITVGLIALGIAWYTLHKKTKAAADVDYPAYGVTGPNKDISPSSGDRRLAQSAQMYHYQHQKQQIIALENRSRSDQHGGISDVESDDDNDEGDYTVYECPGLAPTGEMEVKNPLFLDDTPVTPSASATGTGLTGTAAVTTVVAPTTATLSSSPIPANVSSETKKNSTSKKNNTNRNQNQSNTTSSSPSHQGKNNSGGGKKKPSGK